MYIQKDIYLLTLTIRSFVEKHLNFLLQHTVFVTPLPVTLINMWKAF